MSSFDLEFLGHVVFEVTHPCVLADHVCAVFLFEGGQRVKLGAVVALLVVSDVLGDEVLEEILLQVQFIVILLDELFASACLQDVEI